MVLSIGCLRRLWCVEQHLRCFVCLCLFAFLPWLVGGGFVLLGVCCREGVISTEVGVGSAGSASCRLFVCLCSFVGTRRQDAVVCVPLSDRFPNIEFTYTDIYIYTYTELTVSPRNVNDAEATTTTEETTHRRRVTNGNTKKSAPLVGGLFECVRVCMHGRAGDLTVFVRLIATDGENKRPTERPTDRRTPQATNGGTNGHFLDELE